MMLSHNLKRVVSTGLKFAFPGLKFYLYLYEIVITTETHKAVP